MAVPNTRAKRVVFGPNNTGGYAVFRFPVVFEKRHYIDRSKGYDQHILETTLKEVLRL